MSEKISEQFAEIAQGQFIYCLREFLDDPNHASMTFVEHIKHLEAYAIYLGLDLDAEVAKSGSSFEIKRFYDLKNGKYDKGE